MDRVFSRIRAFVARNVGAMLVMPTLALWASSGHCASEAAAGAAVFSAECAECHSMKEGRNKKGPSLFAMLGRKAASQPGFEYSEELRRTGWTWSPETLHSYLSQPTKKANPGTKMKYEGLADPKALADLIGYLSASP